MSASHYVGADCCPTCGYVFDLASGVTTRGRPEPDDISLCLSCGEALVFAADLHLRCSTPDDTRDWPADVRRTVYAAQREIRARGRLRAKPAAGGIA